MNRNFKPTTPPQANKQNLGDDEFLDLTRLANMMGSPHVSEIYSPPRVTTVAQKMRLIPGLALDLTVNDPADDKPWDFNDEDEVEEYMFSTFFEATGKTPFNRNYFNKKGNYLYVCLE